MKKIIALIFFVTAFCNAQEDHAYVTYGFLRDVGILKADTGANSILITRTQINTAITSAISGVQGGAPDTAQLCLSKQNATENYTSINDARLSDTRIPRSHSHSESDITNLTTDLVGKEPANANIQLHILSAHAPANAQKNSDITKAEIEAKLTGEISSHTHAGGVGGLGYCLNVQAASQSTTTDGQTLYWGGMIVAPSTTANRWRVYIPKPGTIKAAYIYSYAGTAGTNEAWVMNIRKNNTSDTQISSVSAATNDRIWSNTTLNISVVAGDYIEIKEVYPTQATNSATVTRTGQIYIE